MKNVTVKLTGSQAQLLLNIIRNDTEEMKRSGSDRKFILENDRIETRIIKAIIEAEGHPI